MRVTLLIVLAALAVSQAAEFGSIKSYRSDLIDPQIVGGQEAELGQFPWQVYILALFVSSCGGILIHPQWILTAAHCVEGGDFYIYAGVINLDTSLNNETLQQAYSVEKIVHENWDGKVNDIALLKLLEPLKLNEYVKAVRLPPKNNAPSYYRDQGVISGWGNDNSGEPSTVLRFAQNKIVSQLYCKFRYFFMSVADTHICIAGTSWKGACNGDSGGPMVVYENDGIPTVVGITSFGLTRCDWGWPSVYTRVSSYTDWIEKHTGISRQ